ncbi:MAG: Uma2 family endonuclease [Alphaproteobacteria bacterium]|nr:Uma2 family endonuclease [Alphaproteobacteria bacterium]
MANARATYQDVLDAPEGMKAELIGGTLYLSPSPAAPHQYTASVAGGELGFRYHFGDGPLGWIVVYEPELWLGPPHDPTDEVLIPDLAAWRRERYAPHPDGRVGYLARPDWVAEVLSPSTARRDRLLKLSVYAREGIGHAWIVDPIEESVEVYGLTRHGTYELLGGTTGQPVARLAPFDAVDLQIARWWQSSVVPAAR